MISIGPIVVINNETMDLSKRLALTLIELDDNGIVQAIYQTRELTAAAMSDIKSRALLIEDFNSLKTMIIFDPAIESHEQAAYLLYITDANQLLRFRYSFPMGEHLYLGRWQACRPTIKASKFNLELPERSLILSQDLENNLRAMYKSWQESLMQESERAWLIERESTISLADMPTTFCDMEFRLTHKQQQCVLQSGFLSEWQALKKAAFSAKDYLSALMILLQIPLISKAIVERSLVLMEDSSAAAISTEKAWYFLNNNQESIRVTPDYLADNIRILHSLFLVPQLNKLSLSWMEDGGLPTFVEVQFWMLASIFFEVRKYQIQLDDREALSFLDAPYLLTTDNLSNSKLGSINNTNNDLNSDAIYVYHFIEALEDYDRQNAFTHMSDQDMRNLVKLCAGIVGNEEHFWQTREHLELLLQTSDFLNVNIEFQIEKLMEHLFFLKSINVAEDILNNKSRDNALSGAAESKIFECINTVEKYFELYKRIKVAWKRDFLFNLFHKKRQFKEIVECFDDFQLMLYTLESNNKIRKILYIEATLEHWMGFVTTKDQYDILVAFPKISLSEWYDISQLALLKFPDVILNCNILWHLTHKVPDKKLQKVLSSFSVEYWLKLLPDFDSFRQLTFEHKMIKLVCSYIPKDAWRQCVSDFDVLIKSRAKVSGPDSILQYEKFCTIILDNMPVGYLSRLLKIYLNRRVNMYVSPLLSEIIMNRYINTLNVHKNPFWLIGAVVNFNKLLTCFQDKKEVICESLLKFMALEYQKANMDKSVKLEGMFDIGTIKIVLKNYLRYIARLVIPRENSNTFFQIGSSSIGIDSLAISAIQGPEELRGIILRFRLYMEQCPEQDKQTTKYKNIFTYLYKLAYVLSIDRVNYALEPPREPKRVLNIEPNEIEPQRLEFGLN